MLDRKTNIGLEVGKEDYRRLNGERERHTHRHRQTNEVNNFQ